MPAAMLCKLQREKYRETCRVDECKTKCACVVEADESLRKRMEGSWTNVRFLQEIERFSDLNVSKNAIFNSTESVVQKYLIRCHKIASK